MHPLCLCIHQIVSLLGMISHPRGRFGIREMANECITRRECISGSYMAFSYYQIRFNNRLRPVYAVLCHYPLPFNPDMHQNHLNGVLRRYVVHTTLFSFHKTHFLIPTFANTSPTTSRTLPKPLSVIIRLNSG